MQTHVRALQNKSSVQSVHNASLWPCWIAQYCLGLCNIAGQMLCLQNKSCVHSSESLGQLCKNINTCYQCKSNLYAMHPKGPWWIVQKLKHMLSVQIISVRNASKGTLVNCAISVLDLDWPPACVTHSATYCNATIVDGIHCSDDCTCCIVNNFSVTLVNDILDDILIHGF